MHAMVEEHKKKAKIGGLKDLIAQMHKMMMGGDKMEDAMKDAEEEVMGKKDESAVEPEAMASEEGESDMSDKVREYMKKSNKVPVKSSAVLMQVSAKKPVEKKKMKYG